MTILQSTTVALCLSSFALASAQEEARLVSLDANAGDMLAHSVGVSGNTVVLGATGDDDLGFSSGSAYIFTGGVGGWSQQAKLVPSDGGISDRFGWSSGIDGDTVVVGAIFGDGLAAVSGSAYVFTRSAGAWFQQQKLQASDGATSDWYSRSIGISGDTIAVGSAQDDDNGAESGSVYIYERTGNAWSETAKIKPADGAANDTFGEGLSIHGDLLVVGSPQDDDGGSASGSAYVFRRNLGVWSQVAKLTALDPTFNAWFGKTVHTDGQKVIVGAYRGDATGANDCGVAYIFSDNGSGWSEEAKLVASDKTSGDEFGWSVNIQGDEAFAGADTRNTSTGAVYRFVFDGNAWNEDAILLASDTSTSDKYGWAMARDEEVLVVGAIFAPNAPGSTGAGYVLRYASEFVSYCSGDGSGLTCPCGNLGAPAAGCANSATSGAVLSAAGSASVPLDDLSFTAQQLPPNKPALLFVGTQQMNMGDGVIFGDGLRCVGGAIQRLNVVFSAVDGSASWGPGLASAGGWAAGDARNFQVWYRDPVGPCSGGFNLTQGLAIQFRP